MVQKHAASSSKQSTICFSCEQKFPSYYSLQQHRRKEHGAKQRKPSDNVADLNNIVKEEGEDAENLKEKRSAWIQRWRMGDMRYLIFKRQSLIKVDSAEKINIALGFVLRNVKTGEHRYYYAHENNTLFEKSHFVYESGFDCNPGKN